VQEFATGCIARRDVDSKEHLLKSLLNYLWQLRPYSYADLLLLLIACRANGQEILGGSCLWFGFLIHLEWQHRDVNRLRWPGFVWVLTWAIGLVLLFRVSAFIFLGLAILYSLKKRIKVIGIFSFLINGCIKGCLVATLTSSTPALIIALVVVVMSIRNLAGDIRDAGKDAAEGVMSLPVLLGYRRNTAMIYPACLVATSVLWTILGGLSGWLLAIALIIEWGTYYRTPR
jgi:hypothetical protein